MIEALALHVSDFSSRLSSNVKALYRYCPIPPIEYPQLNDELFCHLYYLRHLTDEAKFPNWPIREPVIFVVVVVEILYLYSNKIEFRSNSCGNVWLHGTRKSTKSRTQCRLNRRVQHWT